MTIENGYVTMTIKEYNEMTKGDKLVTREKFMEKYEKALDEMFASDGDENDIYGHDVTIHWNGMFCTAEDGATAYNHIIGGLKDAMTELDDEE